MQARDAVKPDCWKMVGDLGGIVWRVGRSKGQSSGQTLDKHVAEHRKNMVSSDDIASPVKIRDFEDIRCKLKMYTFLLAKNQAFLCLNFPSALQGAHWLRKSEEQSMLNNRSFPVAMFLVASGFSSSAKLHEYLDKCSETS